MDASNEDLRNAGPNFDFEPWRPQSKNHREIPNDSLGIETVIGKYPGNIRTALVYLDMAPDPSGSLASVP